MAYTTGTVAKICGVSREAVRKWVDEFGQYMSESATPPKGEVRDFDDDDVRICALIAEYRNKGFNTDSIHAALKNGDRVEPDMSIQASTPGLSQAKLAALERSVTALRGQIEALEKERDAAVTERDLLERQLSQARQEIKMLNREIGRLQVNSDENE